jgi:indolepyruvate ferredoxin oxidoreductase alpha subunit
MTDTCLCMGAGITVAQGLQRVEPDTLHFAFIGDSTFFHSGITGVINAVYNQTDIIVVILDNSTTAMTGNQPHPGIGRTMMNTQTEKIGLEKIVTALNVSAVVTVNPFDQKAAKEAVCSVMEQKGVRVLIFDSPCVMVAKSGISDKTLLIVSIKQSQCNGCGLCVKKLGCPAISLENNKAAVNAALCTNCGLCMDVCPKGAIQCKKP